MKNRILRSLLILSIFVLMGCSGNENTIKNDINNEGEVSENNITTSESDITAIENSVDTIIESESDNDELNKVVYEGNEQMIEGIARAVATKMHVKNDYLIDTNKYYYSQNDVEKEMTTASFSSVFPMVYYAGNTDNEVLDSEEVINTLNSVFNTLYTEADVEKKGDWKLEDGKIIRDDETVIYDQYVCKWDEENSTFYIEFYYNYCSWAAENVTGIGGYYYKYNRSAAVKFMPADNDLGFAVESVEILNDFNSMAGNPWDLYDYRTEDDFVEINNINWNDLLFGNISGEENALADYMPVLDSSENVLLFSELNSSNAKEVKLDDYKVNSIGFGDINSDNIVDMIMSVYANGEWRMMVVSHIDGQYYAYLFNKFAMMDISQSGYYYSAVGNNTDKYDIKKLDITKDGFSETLVANFNGFNQDAVLEGNNVPYTDLNTWEYSNMGPMVRFWDVKK